MNEPMTRAEHLQWSKDRAIQVLNSGDIPGAYAPMTSDLSKHPETKNHLGNEMGMMLLMSGLLESRQQMREWILGYN